MLTGERPQPRARQGIDASLTLYAEHELNASTFTARVIASTLSDMHSAVAGGVGALKGPLHGGAGEAVMRSSKEIGDGGERRAFAREGAGRQAAIMGFGHRVYKAGDPRADDPQGHGRGGVPAVGPVQVVRDGASSSTRSSTATKGSIPNVDFYSAPLFYSLGIPVDLFTPVIATARIAGWTANIIEQYDDNRLIRPRADYNGPARRAFVAVDKR